MFQVKTKKGSCDNENTNRGKEKVVDVYNTEIIPSMHKIKINDLFSFEVAPIPTALFKDNGEGSIQHKKLI